MDITRRSISKSDWLYSLQPKMEKLCAAAAAAKSLQLWLTLCDPTDGSPLGFSVPGILQARTLEWVAISFSNAWKWKVKVKSPSRARLLATPWTAAYQAPPSMGFSRQEYWSGVPLPSLDIYIYIYIYIYITMGKIPQGAQLGALWWPGGVEGGVEGEEGPRGRGYM